MALALPAIASLALLTAPAANAAAQNAAQPLKAAALAPASAEAAQARTFLKTPYFSTLYEKIAFDGGVAVIPVTQETWAAAGKPKIAVVGYIPEVMTVAYGYKWTKTGMVQTQELYAVSMNVKNWQTAHRLTFAEWNAAGNPMPTATPGLAPHVFIYKHADSDALYMNIDSNPLSEWLWRSEGSPLSYAEWQETGFVTPQVVPVPGK
ncbi:hypothetical protein JT358_13645 [Micrococcales bacterium 31B]|nr:hypothetical protein [Micrococcales bacterium 31B]